MRHIKDPAFVPLFDALPADVQALARKNFALLKSDSRHPSLHFKRIRDDLWSVRVGRKYRARRVVAQDLPRGADGAIHLQARAWGVRGEG